MLKLTWARGLLHFGACFSLMVLMIPAHAGTSTFAIDPQDLPSALRAFAVQSHREIFFTPELARGRQSRGVKGQFDDLKALKIILEGTGLNYSVTPSGAILVRDPADKSTSQPAPAAPGDADSSKEAGKRSSQDFRVAQVDQNAVGSQTVSLNSGKREEGLAEIIVTAQKRNERLQDVPVPVTAISSAALVESNQVRLQDYYTRVPGLSLNTDEYGGTQVSIRGLSSGDYTNPTVGFTVDDVPFGPSTYFADGEQVPDFDPGDLASVEVLRGPQGTLYGASSIGGLIKYVTVNPSTSGFFGSVQAGTNTVRNGAQAGYSFRAAVNVPLSDTFAIRASGFARLDPGYVDNVLSGQKGANKGRADGGLLAGLWQPSDLFSLKLTALLQHRSADGSSYLGSSIATPGLGALQQSFEAGAGAYSRDLQAYNVTLKAKLGAIDVVSVSGYNVSRYANSLDPSYALGPASEFFYQVPGALIENHGRATKFTQEIRFSGSLWGNFDWLVGAFYDDEEAPIGQQQILAVVPATGAIAGELAHTESPTAFSEYAAFANGDYHFTDSFDVQLGARESRNRQSYETSSTGILYGGGVFAENGLSYGNSFTYLVTPRYRVSPDFIAYARIASGYTPGGPNVNVALYHLPASYKASTSENYELGLKGDVFDHTLSVDASIYYIQWKDIQLTLQPGNGSSYNTNGGAAKSQGVELSVESKPARNLTLAAWAAFGDAKLSTDFPKSATAYGAEGDRLPYSTRVSGNASIDEDVPLAANWTGFLGASESYIGNRLGDFRQGAFAIAPPRQSLAGFAQTNLRAGVRHESWTVNLYANNVCDRRGVLKGGLGTYLPSAFGYIEPRVIGVSLAKTF